MVPPIEMGITGRGECVCWCVRVCGVCLRVSCIQRAGRDYARDSDNCLVVAAVVVVALWPISAAAVANFDSRCGSVWQI